MHKIHGKQIILWERRKYFLVKYVNHWKPKRKNEIKSLFNIRIKKIFHEKCECELKHSIWGKDITKILYINKTTLRCIDERIYHDYSSKLYTRPLHRPPIESRSDENNMKLSDAHGHCRYGWLPSSAVDLCSHRT